LAKNNKQVVINRDANAATRTTLAVQLRAQKLTFDEIAKRCGYASPGACRNAIQRELSRTVVENVEELRREECAMLDQLHMQCWERMIDSGYEKSMLFAVDRLIAISERRSRLMGLDVPTNQEVTGNVVVIREVPSGYLGVKSE
jgi:hypothetical protein